MKKRKVTAVILAGGIGSRMMADITKQQMKICGKSVLRHCAIAFFGADAIDDIVFVVRQNEIEFTELEIKDLSTKPYKIVVGGKTRAESAENGFRAIDNNDGLVAIHDCARCLITPEMINRVVKKALETNAATAVALVNDTIKRVENGKIINTVPRNLLVRAQTPQVFDKALYRKALENQTENNQDVTDDNMLVEKIGAEIYCVELGELNMKITTSDDLVIAEQILKSRGDLVV